MLWLTGRVAGGASQVPPGGQIIHSSPLRNTAPEGSPPVYEQLVADHPQMRDPAPRKPGLWNAFERSDLDAALDLYSLHPGVLEAVVSRFSQYLIDIDDKVTIPFEATHASALADRIRALHVELFPPPRTFADLHQEMQGIRDWPEMTPERRVLLGGYHRERAKLRRRTHEHNEDLRNFSTAMLRDVETVISIEHGAAFADGFIARLLKTRLESLGVWELFPSTHPTPPDMHRMIRSEEFLETLSSITGQVYEDFDGIDVSLRADLLTASITGDRGLRRSGERRLLFKPSLNMDGPPAEGTHAYLSYRRSLKRMWDDRLEASDRAFQMLLDSLVAHLGTLGSEPRARLRTMYLIRFHPSVATRHWTEDVLAKLGASGFAPDSSPYRYVVEHQPEWREEVLRLRERSVVFLTTRETGFGKPSMVDPERRRTEVKLFEQAMHRHTAWSRGEIRTLAAFFDNEVDAALLRQWAERQLLRGFQMDGVQNIKLWSIESDQ